MNWGNKQCHADDQALRGSNAISIHLALREIQVHRSMQSILYHLQVDLFLGEGN
jgi:hypothetical protein